ncbi:MAG: glycosyltransferase [Victivallaceae bacterium]|nr:glycosyltransferase [Victivallaceae bacterium]
MKDLKNCSFSRTRFIELLMWMCAALVPAVVVTVQRGGETIYIESQPLYILWIFGVVISALTILYFVFLGILAYGYRPVPPQDDEHVKSCTVIVPAYNEGSHVLDTIRSIVASDFPKDKLEVIAIDDGSKDDTRRWLAQAAAENPGIVRTMFLDVNGGKKHALYLGVKHASGEIIVTVDSDSFVEPDAIRHLVAPFANPKVGAVAGNIRISNISSGIIPQMLDVSFAFGFEFMRCAQSFIGSVLCTPGALSAYRRSAMMPVLDEWLNQTFMGKPSAIGEDRAITSLILKKGYKVLFQNTAMAFTEIPSTYRRACRMLVRWTRSDVRENLSMMKVAFRRLSVLDFSLVGLQINIVAFNLGVFLPVIFLPMSVVMLLIHYNDMAMMLGYAATMSMLWAVLPALIYARRYSISKSVYAFAYAVFSMFFLSWIPVYSVFTAGNSNWLTRELSQREPRERTADSRR